MSETGAQVNGPSGSGKYIDGINPDDPEYIKNLQRPAEVKEDLQQMENRSRVKMVLNSEAFRDELEQMIQEHLQCGPCPESLLALKQITDMLVPQSRGTFGNLGRANTVIPINDLRGVEATCFSKGEKLLRCKLAALYRLIDLCGWSHGIYNHISARVSSEDEHFLINPFGMLYSEVTASSLVKVDVNGSVVEQGSSHLGVNKAGFTLHSAIHQARPDIKCILHLHTPCAVAVSAMKCGLLPMSQEAFIVGDVSYHDYTGILIDAGERELLARNMGVHNKVMILRNHGIVACGETVEEAFHRVSNLMVACETQMKAIPAGIDNIIIPPEEVRRQAFQVGNKGAGGADTSGKKWKTGELEFEALMRTLDNSGYRTGYLYKMPMVKQEKKDRSNSEVEIPPSSSSFTYMFDGDENSKYTSPLKAAMERQKKAYKAGWLTTPNAYKKTEVEEIGTTTPKKITKWVSEDDSPNRPGGTPMKIESPNQFAPQGENPKEFKEKQKSIKKHYYDETVSAGPQSKILDGMSWDEAQKAKDGQLSGAGDQLIVVGAASKGIIQRDHQHNAVVYRQYYAANPFENMSEAEIDKYQREVQRKEAGEPEVEVQPEPSAPTVFEDSNKKQEMQQPQQPVQPEPVQPEGQDAGLARLADKVVQTVIHDALAVARQGKGQQTLTGGTCFDAHLSNQCVMGGQTVETRSNYNDSSDSRGRERIKPSLLQDNNHNNQPSQNHTPLLNFEHGINQSSLRASRSTQEPNANVSSSFSAESQYSDEEYVTIQVNPIHLYHGQTQGRMKIKFSIQSTVRRRVRAELEKGSSIEEIYAVVTDPVVQHCETDTGEYEAEPEDEKGFFVDSVNAEGKERFESPNNTCYKSKEQTAYLEQSVNVRKTEKDTDKRDPPQKQNTSTKKMTTTENEDQKRHNEDQKRHNEDQKRHEHSTKKSVPPEDIPAENQTRFDEISANQTKAQECLVNEESAPHFRKYPKPSLNTGVKYQSKKKSSKSKKKMKAFEKKTPLTSVQEYFEGTNEEMEEFEADLGNADDSFERLLMTAEDSLLLSGQSVKESISSDVLDINEFIGLAPLALDEDEQMNTLETPCTNYHKTLNKKKTPSKRENDVHNSMGEYYSPCSLDPEILKVKTSPTLKATENPDLITRTERQTHPKTNTMADAKRAAHEKRSDIKKHYEENETGDSTVNAKRATIENTDIRASSKQLLKENSQIENATPKKTDIRVSPEQEKTEIKAKSEMGSLKKTLTKANHEQKNQDNTKAEMKSVSAREAQENKNIRVISEQTAQEQAVFISERATHKGEDISVSPQGTQSKNDMSTEHQCVEYQPLHEKQVSMNSSTEVLFMDALENVSTEDPLEFVFSDALEVMHEKLTEKAASHLDNVNDCIAIDNDLHHFPYIDEDDEMNNYQIFRENEAAPFKESETLQDTSIASKEIKDLAGFPLHDTKPEVTIDEPITVKSIEASRYVSGPVGKTETVIDEPTPLRIIETTIDDPRLVKKIETKIDEQLLLEKRETAVEKDMPVKIIEIKVDEPVLLEKRETAIEKDMPVKKIKAVTDESAYVKKFETAIDEPVFVKIMEIPKNEPKPMKTTDTILDEPIPMIGIDVEIDESTIVKKIKTSDPIEMAVDKPHSIERHETTLDDEPLAAKINEMNIDGDPPPFGKIETTLDEPVGFKNLEEKIHNKPLPLKIETATDENPLSIKNIEKATNNESIPIKGIKTAVNEPPSITNIETTIDEPVALKKTEAAIDGEPPPIKKIEVSFDNASSSVKKIDTVVDRIEPGTSVDNNLSSQNNKFKNIGEKEQIYGAHPAIERRTNIDINPVELQNKDAYKSEDAVDDLLLKEHDQPCDMTPELEREPAYYDTIADKNMNTANKYSTPCGKYETDIDEFLSVGIKEIENKDDSYLPIIKKMTTIDDFIKRKDADSKIDDMIPIKKAETYIDDIIPPKKIETAFYDTVSVSKRECQDNNTIRYSQNEDGEKTIGRTENEYNDQPISKENPNQISSIKFDSEKVDVPSHTSHRQADRDQKLSVSPTQREERHDKAYSSKQEGPENMFHSSNSVLDELHLKKHNELMKLSSAKSFFTPPVITVYPVTECPSLTLPPLPDTIDVPSVSDDEGHVQRDDGRRKQKSSMHAVSPPQIPIEKPKWKPKSRRQKGSHQERSEPPRNSDKSETVVRKHESKDKFEVTKDLESTSSSKLHRDSGGVSCPQHYDQRSVEESDRSNRHSSIGSHSKPEKGRKCAENRIDSKDTYEDKEDTGRRNSRRKEEQEKPSSRKERDHRKRESGVGSNDEERRRERKTNEKQNNSRSSDYDTQYDRRRDKRSSKTRDSKDVSDHESDWKPSRKAKSRTSSDYDDRNQDYYSRRSRRQKQDISPEPIEQKENGAHTKAKPEDIVAFSSRSDPGLKAKAINDEKQTHSRKSNDQEFCEMKHGDSRKKTPIDEFLSSPRYEMDVEKSPRLHRRRGGAIAKEPKDKKQDTGKLSPGNARPLSSVSSDHLLSPSKTGIHEKSCTSLASLTGSNKPQNVSAEAHGNLSHEGTDVKKLDTFDNVSEKEDNEKREEKLKKSKDQNKSENDTEPMRFGKRKEQERRSGREIDGDSEMQKDISRKSGREIDGDSEMQKDRSRKSGREIDGDSEMQKDRSRKSGREIDGDSEMQKDRSRKSGREIEDDDESSTGQRRWSGRESDNDFEHDRRRERGKRQVRIPRRKYDTEPNEKDSSDKKTKDEEKALRPKRISAQRKIGVDETNMIRRNQNDLNPPRENTPIDDLELRDTERRGQSGRKTKTGRDKAPEDDKNTQDPLSQEIEPSLFFSQADLDMARPDSDDDLIIPPKKGFLSKLSCVGSRSSDVAKKKHITLSNAPLEKAAPPEQKKKNLDYYEEGEKRKTKKLSKQKRKEDKTGFYFQQWSDESDSNVNEENVPKRKYHEKIDIFQTPKSMASFATDSRDDEDYRDIFNPKDSRPIKSDRSYAGENIKLGRQYGDDGEIERQSNIGKSPRGDDDRPRRSSERFHTDGKASRECSPRSKHADEESPLAGKMWEPRARRDKQSNLKSRPSKSLERPKANGLLGEDVIVSPIEDKTIRQEGSISQQQEVESGLVQLGKDSVSGQLNETSFGNNEMFNFKRHGRRLSLENSILQLSMDTTLGSSGSPPMHRRVSNVSLGTGSSVTRPRSASTVSNPLIHQPWRSKARRRSRSMSISEMVYAAGVNRPRSRSISIGEISHNNTVASYVARRRSRSSSVTEITSRMYQPRLRSRSRGSLGDTSLGSVAPLRQRKYSGSPSFPAEKKVISAAPVKRSESERHPIKNPQLIEELDRKSKVRGQSERRPKGHREELGEDKPVSPSKSDTLKSTDSASGGETLEEHSSKEGSPTKEHPAAKDKKKKKKFRIPSFSKKKNKESKESSI